MEEQTFYDNTPFEYGYSSKADIIVNMNPLLKKVMEDNAGKVFTAFSYSFGTSIPF